MPSWRQSCPQVVSPSLNEPTFLFAFTESREDSSVYDLFELAKVNKKHHGVSLVKGPDPYSPAYKILNPNLIPVIPERFFRDLIYSIQEEKGFLFVANLKQAKNTRGSLFSVERRDGSGSIFELVSNGNANTLDLVYATASGQHEVSIEDARLATGSWLNITLFVQEDRAQLYIGCEEINTSELDEPIHQILTQDVADVSVLRIGKGAVKSRFMVSASEIEFPKRTRLIRQLVMLGNVRLLIFFKEESWIESGFFHIPHTEIYSLSVEINDLEA